MACSLPRQKYWSGLAFPSPGDLSDPGIEARCLRSPALAGGFFTTVTTLKVGKVYLFQSYSPGVCFGIGSLEADPEKKSIL